MNSAQSRLNDRSVSSEMRQNPMLDVQKIAQRLKGHVEALAVEIGERSVYLPANLQRTARYIEDFYAGIGLPVELEAYTFRDIQVANVISEVGAARNPSKRYLLGAHYDSVAGTVGADDNASAVAVQLETARLLKSLDDHRPLDIAVKFVSFALEEPPAFLTRYRGSRVHARNAKRRKEKIDGMLCLEMVGFTSPKQQYPFPLMFRNYPKEGNFIGIVGNFRSRKFTRSLLNAFRKNPELPVISLTVPLGGWILPAVRLSDHTSFWERGYKAVMITDTAFYRNPHYHLSSDTPDKLDYSFMAELVESLFLFFYSHCR